MKRLILLLIVPFFFTQSYGQYQSLLSANGEGSNKSSVFSLNRLNGDLSAAYSNSLVCNFQNPASYADATLTTIEFGVKGETGSYTYKDSTMSSGGAGLTHFAMTMPMKLGKSGFALGFYQNSNAKYGVVSSNTDALFGKYSNRITGQGGTYKAFVGTGFRFGRLKLGGNLITQFGNLKSFDEILFIDSALLPSIKSTSSNTIFGLSYTLGTQYEVVLDKKNALLLGAYYDGSLFKNNSYQFDRELIYSVTSTTTNSTTVSSASGNSSYPYASKFGVGVSYISNNYLTLGTEFNTQDFSEFKNKFDTASMQRAWHVNFGLEYSPSKNRDVDSRKYFNKITYRTGIVLGKSEQNYSNTLNDLKLSGGVSLPILGRSVGYITLGTSYQIRGFGAENAVSESIFSFHAILTFADRWFVKSKFD